METYTRIFSVFRFVAATEPKATHRNILTLRSNHDTSSARSALCAIQDGGRGNFNGL